MLDFAETHALFNRKFDFRDTADPLGPLGFWLSNMAESEKTLGTRLYADGTGATSACILSIFREIYLIHVLNLTTKYVRGP